MTTMPELTAADGTPEEPLPESPVLTAHDDDKPRHGNRPRLHVQPVTYRASGKVRIPGIGLLRHGTMHAHLTPAEAYALANRLVDLADRIQATEKGTN